jgi:hypothetical protein
MATNAKDRRKRGMWIIVALIAAAALCLLAMAAGWISSPLWDSMFGGNGSGSSQTSGNGSGSGGGGGCFLNVICFNGSGSDKGINASGDATLQP